MTPTPSDGDSVPCPDRQLRLALGGDENAAKFLYDKYKPHFVRLARKRAPDLAEDLWEEAFNEMWLLVFKRGVSAFESSGTTAEVYLTQVHRNAVESVRAAYRSPGTRSRAMEPTFATGAEDQTRLQRDADSLEPVDETDAWFAPDRIRDVDEFADASNWSNRYEYLDRKMDIERLVSRQRDPLVRKALGIMMGNGTTISETADILSTTRQTLGRRLQAIAA